VLVTQNLSCAGVTASILTPLVPPLASVTINIPAGQQANIEVLSTDRIAGTVTTFSYPAMSAPGGTQLVPIACFPKLVVLCAGNIIDPPFYVEGENQCGLLGSR
jgi:hypothetical protein